MEESIITKIERGGIDKERNWEKVKDGINSNKDINYHCRKERNYWIKKIRKRFQISKSGACNFNIFRFWLIVRYLT